VPPLSLRGLDTPWIWCWVVPRDEKKTPCPWRETDPSGSTRHQTFKVKGIVVKTYWGWRYSATHPWPRYSKRWVVIFMPRPLYLRGKSPRYPLDSLGGPQSRSGYGGEKFLALAGNRTPIVQPLASLYTDWATPALKGICCGDVEWILCYAVLVNGPEPHRILSFSQLFGERHQWECVFHLFGIECSIGGLVRWRGWTFEYHYRGISRVADCTDIEIPHIDNIDCYKIPIQNLKYRWMVVTSTSGGTGGCPFPHLSRHLVLRVGIPPPPASLLFHALSKEVSKDVTSSKFYICQYILS
jgi:hypothetical protein